VANLEFLHENYNGSFLCFNCRIFYLSAIFYQSYSHSTSATTQATTATSTATNIFTAETLSQYNGKNGNAAYIAVDGVVYDVSSLFRNGEHHGWGAGKDLSDEFHKEHTDNYLDGYSVVGTYQE